MTFWQRLTARFGVRPVMRLLRFYPPYFGAGVRVTRMDAPVRRVDVAMTLHWWNRNYFGTHFGGSLYSMCDPFFALMVMQAIGHEYVVWDKAASIRFVRPGRGRVTARFELTEEQVQQIRAEVAAEGRSQPHFQVVVTNAAGEPVARVEKVLSVKRKAGAAAGDVARAGAEDRHAR